MSHFMRDVYTIMVSAYWRLGQRAVASLSYDFVMKHLRPK